MAICIIIHKTSNENLLRLTETKVFFDAKNNHIDLFSDCYVIENINKIKDFLELDNLIVVIKTGYFLTTAYRNKLKDKSGIHFVSDNDPDVIYFDEDTIISFKKQSKYKSPSKQNYIIENTLKTVINSKKLIYYENTENYEYKNYSNIKNLYGLASGWKTIKLAKDIGLENLNNIIVYDYNPTQLDYAKQIHNNLFREKNIELQKYKIGDYNCPLDLIDFLEDWKKFPVKFQLIDLFSIPKFLEHSLVWVSNVFKYEPNIFIFGWEESKNKRKRLIKENPSCIIIES